MRTRHGTTRLLTSHRFVSRRFVWRNATLLWLASCFVFKPCWSQLTPAPPRLNAKPVPSSIKAYRAQLEKAANALRTMETQPPRHLDKVLTPLDKTYILKRADGETQTVYGDEWQRRVDELTPNAATNSGKTTKPQAATRAQVRAARRAVEQRLRALDAWDRPPETAYRPATNAGVIIRQLENTGQIRTTPTASQQFWADVARWVGETLEKFFAWLGSLFPNPSPNRSAPPKIDERWLNALFSLSVIALLGVVGYLTWRAIGGRWRRETSRATAHFDGEDAELLLLPPDELTERARKFAEQGNFREALRHLYVALLLNLDRNGVWRYDARRTNWEHIADLQRSIATQSTLGALQRPAVEILADLTRRFDRVRYGNAPCSFEDWTRFAHDVEQLRAQLGTRQGSSATQAAVKP
jgi:hypothetical protein